jgi:hypothetical protein
LELTGSRHHLPRKGPNLDPAGIASVAQTPRPARPDPDSLSSTWLGGCRAWLTLKWLRKFRVADSDPELVERLGDVESGRPDPEPDPNLPIKSGCQNVHKGSNL